MSRRDLIKSAVISHCIVNPAAELRTVTGTQFFLGYGALQKYQRPAQMDEVIRECLTFVDGVFLPGVGVLPFMEAQHGS